MRMTALRESFPRILILLSFLLVEARARPAAWEAEDHSGRSAGEASPALPGLRVIPGVAGPGGSLLPEAIEVGGEGDLYVIDGRGSRLSKYDPEGLLSWTIDGGEWGGGPFLDPEGIAVSSGSQLFLLDTGRRRIFQVSRRGEIVGVVAEESLQDPRAIALTASGKLAVYDGSSSEVSVLSPAGGILWSFQPAGFRSRTRVRMVLKDEEDLCLFTRGSPAIRVYHFMGGLERVWRPGVPGVGELSVSSVAFDAGGHAFVLDDRLPGLFVYDGLGNLVVDLREELRALGYQGPGDVRPLGESVFLSDLQGGKVYRFSLPPGGR